MSESPSRDELLELLGALVNQTIDDQQHQRLEELLAVDAKTRQLYFDYLDVHLGLHQWQMGRQERQPLEDLQRQLAIVVKPRPRRAKWTTLATYTAVAAAAFLAALLLAQRYRDGRAGQLAPPSGATEYVATLGREIECVWELSETPPFSGMRLAPGELRLKSGVMEVAFDSGPELIVQGPAQLRIESQSLAVLTRGKVVLKSDETADRFVLRTPWSTLVDLGTEYAVSVEPTSEELHVFEGEVHRRARQTPPDAPREERLAAGSARQYRGPNGAQSEAIALGSDRFVRTMPEPKTTPTGAAAGLLAYESFDYGASDALTSGTGDGGVGWRGPWKQWSPDKLMLLTLHGLHRERETNDAPGGCLAYQGIASAHRALRAPIRLDRDGVWYFSFLFQRSHGGGTVPNVDSPSALDDLLMSFTPSAPDPAKNLSVGIGGRDHVVFVRFDGASRVSLPLDFDKTYLLVGKIAAAAKQPDQVFLRVYGPREPVDRREPQVWSLASRSVLSDLTLDGVTLHVHSQGLQQLDELRIGMTWASVVSPWVE